MDKKITANEYIDFINDHFGDDDRPPCMKCNPDKIERCAETGFMCKIFKKYMRNGNVIDKEAHLPTRQYIKKTRTEPTL